MQRFRKRGRCGRPRLPAGRLRARPLVVRLNDGEREVLRRRAALAGLPVAAYVRECALRRGGTPRPVPAVEVRALGVLGRLACDLRGLAELAEQGQGAPVLPACLERLLAEVSALHRLLAGLPAAREAGAVSPAAGAQRDP
jgi:hypothetical protein